VAHDHQAKKTSRTYANYACVVQTIRSVSSELLSRKAQQALMPRIPAYLPRVLREFSVRRQNGSTAKGTFHGFHSLTISPTFPRVPDVDAV